MRCIEYFIVKWICTHNSILNQRAVEIKINSKINDSNNTKDESKISGESCEVNGTFYMTDKCKAINAVWSARGVKTYRDMT